MATKRGVIAQNERFVIYSPQADETLRSLARDFLGDVERYWEIAEFNGIAQATPGEPLVIPLHSRNPIGVFRDGYQTVPILTYHRFGHKDGNKMVVTPEAFAAQLDALEQQNYHVVRLSDLGEFLSAKRALPKRSVIITIDDGYASTYTHAYPLLKKHGFPATVFLYTDFVGARDALTWPQMQEMVKSGLIDIQSHSKTHANLTDRLRDESDEAYRKRLDAEIRTPQRVLKEHLGLSIDSFAYPYGNANRQVVERLSQAGYDLAVTVNAGSNPFFADPLMLQRTMVFGDMDLDQFKSKLQTFRAASPQ